VQSTEELTDAAVATLIARLDGELTKIEQRYAGTFRDLGALPRPRTGPDETIPNLTGDFWPGGVTTITRMPVVEVAVPDLDGDNFSIGQHESDVTPTIVIRAWLEDVDVQRLYRLCSRYGSAIHNALMDPDAVTGTGSGFGPGISVQRYSMRWRYNPETDTQDQIRSAVVLLYYLDAPDVRP
jgi:hypothetical protein